MVIGAWTHVTSAQNQHVQSKPWSSFRLSAQCAIHDAIDDVSDTVRGVITQAARRLREERADNALRQAFRSGVHIVAFIEKEKSKEKG